MNEKKIYLTYDQAQELMPEGDVVHTYLRGGMGMLIGVDWDKVDINSQIQKYGVELSGEIATKMHHGLVIIRPKQIGGPLFVQTKDTFMGLWPEENDGDA